MKEPCQLSIGFHWKCNVKLNLKTQTESLTTGVCRLILPQLSVVMWFLKMLVQNNQHVKSTPVEPVTTTLSKSRLFCQCIGIDTSHCPMAHELRVGQEDFDKVSFKMLCKQLSMNEILKKTVGQRFSGSSSFVNTCKYNTTHQELRISWCHYHIWRYHTCQKTQHKLHVMGHLCAINSLRPRRNRCHFADDIFKCIFLNENEWISLRFSLKFVNRVRILTIFHHWFR